MQQEEFESLTGFRPSQGMYRAITNEYIKSGLDAAEFCRRYSLNIGGIAQKIQRLVDREEINQKQEIAELQERLNAELDCDGNEEDLRCKNAAEQKTTPEGQRPDEDLFAYMERAEPELFASMKYLAEISSISKSEEDPENIRPPPYN
ncbi:MAG: hypothetical protein K2H82_05520 [Oscillospiraceae bacterium]|nr:hypothetical protein [Oscillospiraceae bacterium]